MRAKRMHFRICSEGNGAWKRPCCGARATGTWGQPGLSPPPAPHRALRRADTILLGAEHPQPCPEGCGWQGSMEHPHGVGPASSPGIPAREAPRSGCSALLQPLPRVFGRHWEGRGTMWASTTPRTHPHPRAPSQPPMHTTILVHIPILLHTHPCTPTPIRAHPHPHAHPHSCAHPHPRAHAHPPVHTHACGG